MMTDEGRWGHYTEALAVDRATLLEEVVRTDAAGLYAERDKLLARLIKVDAELWQIRQDCEESS